MSNTEIYLIGVVFSLVIGLLSLTFTKDKECNISRLGCIASAVIMSLLSWFGVVIFILSEVRNKFVKGR